MAENMRELVDKLIALALNNPNAEEARSAAMKAVSLIREHKLLDAARPTYQPMPGQPTPVYYQPPPSYPTPQTPPFKTAYPDPYWSPPPVDWNERLRQAQKELDEMQRRQRGQQPYAAKFRQAWTDYVSAKQKT